VQHERVGIDAQFRHDERNAVLHQAGNVVNIAGQPVELRDDDGSLGLAGAVDSGVERRPVIVSAGFVLLERIQEGREARLAPTWLKLPSPRWRKGSPHFRDRLIPQSAMQ
jgi:hypothetical protein